MLDCGEEKKVIKSQVTVPLCTGAFVSEYIYSEG
jgi:hypothetical protein